MRQLVVGMLALVTTSSIVSVIVFPSSRKPKPYDSEDPHYWATTLRKLPDELWLAELEKRLHILDGQLRSFGVLRAPTPEIRNWCEQAQL